MNRLSVPTAKALLLFVLAAALAPLVLTAPAVAAGSSPEPPDLLLLNGRIFTSLAARPYVQALAIRGGRVVATGASEKIRTLGGPGTRQIDLHGRTVIPGINDAHHHLGVHPPHASELEFKGPNPAWPEVRAALAAAVVKEPKGTFLFGDIASATFRDLQVDRDAVDKVAPDHPVLLRTRSGHAAIANTAALAAARIGEDEKDPAGGRFERLPNGRLSGVLREYAWKLVERRIADLASEPEAVTEWRESLAQAARFGITSIQDMSPSLPPEHVVALLEKVPSPLRVRLIRMPLTSPTGRDLTEGWPAPRVSNPLIRVSGMKWIADGTPTEGTFAPRQDAAGDASARNRYLAHLQLMFPEGEYAAMLRESLAHNEQLLLHVSGYPAAEVVLGAMKASGGRAAWAAKRVRFEHGSGLLPDLLPLVKELGIIVVQNPTHLDVGSAEAIKAKPLRSLLAAGIPLALGSDGPRNPYVDIMLAATHPDRPAEAITREQAVIAYTLTSAYAEFEEKEKGSLEPGKLADLAVLSQDIFTVPIPELPKTESVLTLVGGKVVYDAEVVGTE